MWSFFGFLTLVLAASAQDLVNQFDSGLQSLLSTNATITHNGTVRWSEFNAPTPGTVVNVATEKDVQVTVRRDYSFDHDKRCPC
jgi:hypothetical protein